MERSPEALGPHLAERLTRAGDPVNKAERATCSRWATSGPQFWATVDRDRRGRASYSHSQATARVEKTDGRAFPGANHVATTVTRQRHRHSRVAPSIETASPRSLTQFGPQFWATVVKWSVISCQSRERKCTRGFGLYWSW